MSDLISRQSALDALVRRHEELATHQCYALANGVGESIEVIKELPSTDCKGEWVGVYEYCHHLTEVTGEKYLPLGLENYNFCNQCWQSAQEKSKYCPNCGADMRGEQDETD